jgi:hypothetical protein
VVGLGQYVTVGCHDPTARITLTVGSDLVSCKVTNTSNVSPFAVVSWPPGAGCYLEGTCTSVLPALGLLHVKTDSDYEGLIPVSFKLRSSEGGGNYTLGLRVSVSLLPSRVVFPSGVSPFHEIEEDTDLVLPAFTVPGVRFSKVISVAVDPPEAGAVRLCREDGTLVRLITDLNNYDSGGRYVNGSVQGLGCVSEVWGDCRTSDQFFSLTALS